MASDDGRVLTRLRKAVYLGSHPDRTGQTEDVTVTFFVGGVQADPWKGPELFSHRWSDLTVLRAEDRDAIEGRITATRVLALGMFAMAVPKRKTTSYLSIGDTKGEWVFAIPGLNAIELGSGLKPLQTRLPQKPDLPLATTAPSAAPEPTDRLTKLAALLDAGLITSDEFDAKRAEILRDL